MLNMEYGPSAWLIWIHFTHSVHCRKMGNLCWQSKVRQNSAPHSQNSRIFMNIHDTSRYLPNFKNWSVRLPTAFPKSWNQLRGMVSRFPWTWLALMLRASAPRKKHEKWGVMAIIHGWFHNGQYLLWYVLISYDYMIFYRIRNLMITGNLGMGLCLTWLFFLNVHFNNSENEIVGLAI